MSARISDAGGHGGPGEVAGEDLRHLPVLEALSGCGHVSQRSLARRLGVAASLVNRLIRELLDAGHLEVVDPSVRPFAYRLTPAGRTYRRRLSHHHYRTVLGNFRAVQDAIRKRLRTVLAEEVRRTVFYGAGEVMEATLPLARELGLEVVGVVDDDPEKQGRRRAGLVVHPPSTIDALEPDAVLITTFRHAREIRIRLGDLVRPSLPVLEL